MYTGSDSNMMVPFGAAPARAACRLRALEARSIYIQRERDREREREREIYTYTYMPEARGSVGQPPSEGDAGFVLVRVTAVLLLETPEISIESLEGSSAILPKTFANTAQKYIKLPARETSYSTANFGPYNSAISLTKGSL